MSSTSGSGLPSGSGAPRYLSNLRPPPALPAYTTTAWFQPSQRMRGYCHVFSATAGQGAWRRACHTCRAQALRKSERQRRQQPTVRRSAPLRRSRLRTRRLPRYIIIARVCGKVRTVLRGGQERVQLGAVVVVPLGWAAPSAVAGRRECRAVAPSTLSSNAPFKEGA
jgi:hypothetical protein